jgi:membrane-associated protein
MAQRGASKYKVLKTPAKPPASAAFMDAFQTFVRQFSAYGYPVLFIGVLLENAGIPVPGETAVLVAGFLSSPAGGSHFNVLWVILITLTAAVIGDNIGFWLGHRWARPRLQAGRRFLFLTPQALKLAEGYFHRYGIWTIFFARFITGLRVVGAVAAGTAGMHWTHFFVANASGALAWAVTMSLLGYFFGHSWELLHKWLGRGGLVLLGCVVLLVGLPYLWRHLRKTRPALIDRLPRSQILQGLIVALLEVICIGVLAQISAREQDTRLDLSVQEWVESGAKNFPFTVDLANAARLFGTLPVSIIVAGVTAAFSLRYQRRWREWVVLLWALVASEIVGLALVAFLRLHTIDPEYLVTLPLGYAGLVPIRVIAVFGTVAYVVARWNRYAGRIAFSVATAVVLLATWSILWRAEQRFTEVLLEHTAGGIILFAGIWWLEGYGPGLQPANPDVAGGDSR